MRQAAQMQRMMKKRTAEDERVARCNLSAATAHNWQCALNLSLILICLHLFRMAYVISQHVFRSCHATDIIRCRSSCFIQAR